MKKEKSNKKGTVSPVVKKSIAVDYLAPNINTVAVNIVADDPKFIPSTNDDGTVVIKAKDGAILPHRATISVDCGFSMTLKPGWQAFVNAIPFWAAKGLIVTTPILENRVKVYVTNVGKEIVAINSGDNIAQITVGPTYLINWITNG